MKKNIAKLLVLALAVMSVMLAFASCGCSHEEKVIPAKDATCTAEGATEGKECAKCGEILVAPEATPKLAHTSEEVAKQEATCTEDGHEAGTKCSVCDTVLTGMEKIPAAHTPVDVEAKEETCVIAGHTAGKKCSVCNEILEGVTTIEPDPSKHNIREVEAVEVKCLENGSTAGGYCLNDGCDYEYGMETIPYPGHTVVDVERQEPTCTEKGYEAGRVCSVCGDVAQGRGDIPALGHTPDETKTVVTKEPTLGVKGTGTGECLVCKEDIEIEFAALPGRVWDYENADDHGLEVKGNTAILKTEMKNEDGRSYVKFSYDTTTEEAKNAKKGEWNVFFSPETEHSMFTADKKYIFETDIRFDNINLTDTYKTNSNPWMIYVTLTDSDSPAGDYNHVLTQMHTKPTDDGLVLTIDDNKGVNRIIPYEEWFKLKVEFTISEDLKTVTMTFYVNNEKFHTKDLSAINPSSGSSYEGYFNTPKFNDPIYGVKLKFKGQGNYNTYSISLDNTSFAEETIVEEVPTIPVTDYPDAPASGLYATAEGVLTYDAEYAKNLAELGFSAGTTSNVTVNEGVTAYNPNAAIGAGWLNQLITVGGTNKVLELGKVLKGDAESKTEGFPFLGNRPIMDTVNATGNRYVFETDYMWLGSENGVSNASGAAKSGYALRIELFNNESGQMFDYFCGMINEESDSLFFGNRDSGLANGVELQKGVWYTIRIEYAPTAADAEGNQYGTWKIFINNEEKLAAAEPVKVYKNTTKNNSFDKVRIECRGYIVDMNQLLDNTYASAITVEEPEVEEPAGPVEIGEGIYTGENEIAVTDTIYGTAITITRAGKYTIAPAEGETNADIMVNNLPVAAPYSFEVAEGASVTINVVTKDFQEGTVKVVIAEQE